MKLYRNTLYILLFSACVVGYIWVYFNITNNSGDSKSTEVCLIKHITNIPCPSCGSTRSVISITKGNFVEAFDLNPIGYIVAIIMLIAPVWIITDLILRNNSLFVCYQKIEKQLKNPNYAVPLILIIIINWIWNITKGL